MVDVFIIFGMTFTGFLILAMVLDVSFGLSIPTIITGLARGDLGHTVKKSFLQPGDKVFVKHRGQFYAGEVREIYKSLKTVHVNYYDREVDRASVAANLFSVSLSKVVLPEYMSPGHQVLFMEKN